MTNKIKILHFVHSLVSGGAEKQLRLLVNGINKDNFEIGVFCVNCDGHDIDLNNVTLICSETEKTIGVRYLKNIYSAIKSFDPDIVHIWLPASISIPALLIGKLLGKKCIFSYRNKMYFHRGLSYPEFFCALFCSRKIVSNHIIYDSHFLFKWLYKIKNGEVIYNAVDVPARYIREKPIENAGERMIFVGRLTNQKNPLRLIKALSSLLHIGSWRLDIFGEGELKDEIIGQIAKSKLQDRIFVNGFSHNIYEELQRSTALIFPSLKEGMPNVLVEAMTVGIPIVASNIVANRSVLGNDNNVAGIYINPEDENDIAEKLEKLISNSISINSMLKQAKKISSEFTLQSMVNKYEDCYRKMVDD